jgi:hypothetical protein
LINGFTVIFSLHIDKHKGVYDEHLAIEKATQKKKRKQAL